MRNTWLQEQLTAISDEKYQFIIDEAVKYIEQLEDDNESLQVALEGNIWSPKKWNQKANNFLLCRFCSLRMIICRIGI